ncbi:response regulator [Pararcticibacter amylolyticus]|nr:response regulator [Pararcticibacter amylolyticus]
MMKVLLVCEKTEDVLLLETLLKRDNVELVKTSSVAEALKVCSEDSIAIAVVDLEMAEMTDLSVVKNINSVSYLKDMSFIFLTTNLIGSRNTFNRFSVGRVDYLYKPLNPDIVNAKFDLFLSLVRLKNELEQQKAEAGRVQNELTLLKDRCVPERKSVRKELSKFENLRILVAEDNSISQFMIKKVLSSWNIDVDIADNGEMVLAKVSENKYDLILMDTYMPVMGGFEATRIIRSQQTDEINRIPIISLTASILEEERTEALRSGADEVLTKPFDPEILHSRIVKYTRIGGIA